MRSVAKIKYYNATTVEEACEVLAANEGKAKVYAGGTDVLDWLKRRYMATPEVVVNIKNIPGMRPKDRRMCNINRLKEQRYCPKQV
jgi:CO/xanthine dehydrogenase FAD-binding subunit